MAAKKTAAKEMRATENVAIWHGDREHQIRIGDVVKSSDPLVKSHGWLFEPVE